MDLGALDSSEFTLTPLPEVSGDVYLLPCCEVRLPHKCISEMELVDSWCQKAHLCDTKIVSRECSLSWCPGVGPLTKTFTRRHGRRERAMSPSDDLLLTLSKSKQPKRQGTYSHCGHTGTSLDRVDLRNGADKRPQGNVKSSSKLKLIGVHSVTFPTMTVILTANFCVFVATWELFVVSLMFLWCLSDVSLMWFGCLSDVYLMFICTFWMFPNRFLAKMPPPQVNICGSTCMNYLCGKIFFLFSQRTLSHLNSSPFCFPPYFSKKKKKMY